MYDVVGDKIQEIFDAQVVDIGIYDSADGAHPLPVHDRARRPLPGRTEADRALLSRRDSFERRRHRSCSSDVDAWFAERGESQWVPQGEPAKSMLLAPLISGDEVRGRISLQNLDRTMRSPRTTSVC